MKKKHLIICALSIAFLAVGLGAGYFIGTSLQANRQAIGCDTESLFRPQNYPKAFVVVSSALIRTLMKQLSMITLTVQT